MRRRFRRHPKWVWAGADNVSRTDINTPAWAVSDVVMPPGRAQWLMEQARRDKLIVKGILLWMDFHWLSTSTTATPNLPDCELYIKRTASDAVSTNQAADESPFSSPTVPATLTTWDQAAVDGTDRFLWAHWIKGSSPPNFIVRTKDAENSPTRFGNQSIIIGEAESTFEGSQSLMCRTFRVAAEWQPDIRVKTACRLMKGDGLAMILKTSGTNSGVTCSLSYKVRVLAL